jgi:hypothetical protein
MFGKGGTNGPLKLGGGGGGMPPGNAPGWNGGGGGNGCIGICPENCWGGKGGALKGIDGGWDEPCAKFCGGTGY